MGAAAGMSPCKLERLAAPPGGPYCWRQRSVHREFPCTPPLPGPVRMYGLTHFAIAVRDPHPTFDFQRTGTRRITRKHGGCALVGTVDDGSRSTANMPATSQPGVSCRRLSRRHAPPATRPRCPALQPRPQRTRRRSGRAEDRIHLGRGTRPGRALRCFTPPDAHRDRGYRHTSDVHVRRARGGAVNPGLGDHVHKDPIAPMLRG